MATTAAHRISSAHAPSNTLAIEYELEDGTIRTLKIRKFQYIPRPIADASDKWIEKEIEEGRTPDELALMEYLIRELAPDEIDHIAAMSIGERREIWDYWEKESKVDMGKSDASENS